MPVRSVLRAAALLAVACSLQACETLQRAGDDSRADERRATKALESSMTCEGDRASRRIYDAIWLGDGGVSDPADGLPANFKTGTALSLRSAAELSLAQILAELSNALGWRIYLAQDELRGATGSTPGAALPIAGPAVPAGTMRLDFTGSVPAALDAIARRFNLAWDTAPGERTIRFTRNQTRTFQLAGLPADIVVRNAVDPSGTSSQGSGGSGLQITANPQPGRQQVTTNIDQSKVWQQIEDGVKTILGAQGDVSLSPGTGLVVVRATPDRMREVEAYIRLQNETRLRAVSVRIVVLNVRISNSDEYAARLQPAFAERGLAISTAAPSSVAATTGFGRITAGIISAPPASEEYRRFASSQAIIQALSTLGRVSVRNEVTVFTLNDQPTPLLVGSQTSYLASVSQSAVSSAGVQTSLVPGIVTSGTSLNILPRIRADGRLVLNYALSISELRRLNNVTSGGQTIQVPEVDTRAVQQAIEIGNCETLLITGFQQDRSTVQREGTGWPDFLLPLGGAASGARNTDMLAIIMTPELRSVQPGGRN